MRVGINTLFLVPGDVGGTEVYFRQNLKHMVADNQQDTFILFTTRDNDESLQKGLVDHSNVEFVRLPFRAAVRPARILAEQFLLPFYVWKKADVLWSPGYTAPLFCSCPQAVTIHDLQYKSHPDDLTFLERLTLDFLVKNACKRCDAVITVSEFSKRELLRFNFAEEEKVFAIPEGVDPGFGERANRDAREIVNVPRNTPYILCVAHTYPHKQVHLLVEAFGQLDGQIPHHLVLVGKARRGEERLVKSIDLLPNTAKFHRVSNLAYPDLKCLYQEADIFVLPSQYEGFGLPVLEAMLAGVRVITTNMASLPEVGGNHAVYVEENRAGALAGVILQTVNEELSLKENSIKNGKAWAASFSWKKSAEQTMEAVAALVA